MARHDLIELNDVGVKYVGRKDPALHAMNLRFNAGETVLLLGASGCGKSTLALTLNGLIPQAIGASLAGSVMVDQLDTQQHAVAQLATHLGIIFQDPESQFVTLTVEDEILFGLENLRVSPDEMPARVTTALAQVGMSAYRRARVDALSGGQKQRVALAALLALQSHILVFDEPTANLDPIGTRDVFALLAELKAQGRHTLILIEHKLDELMHLIDRVVVLGQRGAILADGAPRTVFDQHTEVFAQHGVWMPQVSQLAHRLRKRGQHVQPFPITLEDAVALPSVPIETTSNTGATTTPGIPSTPSATHWDAPPAVEVRQLTFRYGNDIALNDVSLTVPKGDFLAIVGANGAGKTTLAQHLVGILRAPANTVHLEGVEINRIAASALIQKIGYVFQNPEHQFITDAVAEEIAFGLRSMKLPPAEVETRTQALLDRFGLTRYAKANPFTLSHGEKRRLSVATMLAVGQHTLILDEPTFGQDARNAAAMMALLRDLHDEGRTIIIITHDMTLVAEHARHVAVMAEGALRFHGTTADAFAQPDLLAQAQLSLPPVAQLAQQRGWPNVLTLDEAEQFLSQTVRQAPAA